MEYKLTGTLVTCFSNQIKDITYMGKKSMLTIFSNSD